MHASVLAQLKEQFQFFQEQRIVILELKAKERKGFDEGASAYDHLRASARDQINRRKLLKYADRVVSAENCHCTR